MQLNQQKMEQNQQHMLDEIKKLRQQLDKH